MLCTIVLFTVDKYTPQYDPWLSVCGFSITARADTSKLALNMVSGWQTWAGDLKTMEQKTLCLTEQASS